MFPYLIQAGTSASSGDYCVGRVGGGFRASQFVRDSGSQGYNLVSGSTMLGLPTVILSMCREVV